MKPYTEYHKLRKEIELEIQKEHFDLSKNEQFLESFNNMNSLLTGENKTNNDIISEIKATFNGYEISESIEWELMF